MKSLSVKRCVRIIIVDICRGTFLPVLAASRRYSYDVPRLGQLMQLAPAVYIICLAAEVVDVEGLLCFLL